ncbi:unnamed protein product [Cladocopium goreaui]|uniref:Uncharacterized protein n=1 Tax=Cladocopium goreaui TaxID=2562237 RepID=A0A9P1GH38_9DINO|nr:unnamed protein product [Cladocopium goreaui]
MAIWQAHIKPVGKGGAFNSKSSWQTPVKGADKGGKGGGMMNTMGKGGKGGGAKGPLMMMAALMKGMKGKGKGKGKGKNTSRGKGHTLPRERVSETPMIGEVLEWKGKYGWIKPQEPIEHEKASRHGGKLFVSQADLVGVTELSSGRLVQFQLFEDSSGLGAEEVLQA